MNFFNLNYTFPMMGMNNWFMPNWSFPNFSSFFQMPTFNYWLTPNLNYGYQMPIMQQSLFSLNYNNRAINPKTGNNALNEVQKTNTDTFIKSSSINYAKDNLKLDDYNEFKGERLARIALNNSVGWTGYCASYVKSDIQAAGLGPYTKGHAYQMPKILRKNPNFKEIYVNNVDVSKLPAGCILVYGKGVEGYSDDYGHTEITTGDGRAVSDGVTKNLYKKPSNIFIPV